MDGLLGKFSALWLCPGVFCSLKPCSCLAGRRLVGGGEGVRLAAVQRPGHLQRPLSGELHQAPGVGLQMLQKSHMTGF